MALKRPKWKPGTVVTLEHASGVLKDNPLGDPHVRKLAVWLPPQYDAGAGRGRRFPVLFDLVGFTGSGLAHVAWKNFSDNVPERAARLVHEGRMGPAILVFPDCFTALGGNQYVNSSAIGRYADYLTRELVPFVDREFRTLASRDHRGCFGKSSGGYGAMLHGMKYASTWGAIADHSGDAYFDFVYWHDWPNTLNELAKYRARKQKPGRYDALRGIYIDCGWRDQFHIHYGSRILSRRLHEAGIEHSYEEFDDDHSDIDYRMDVSLPFLYRALKP